MIQEIVVEHDTFALHCCGGVKGKTVNSAFAQRNGETNDERNHSLFIIVYNQNHLRDVLTVEYGIGGVADDTQMILLDERGHVHLSFALFQQTTSR